jgi:hypothetical protein
MPEIKEKRDGLNCKIVDNKCAERQQGSYGKCRFCEFSTVIRKIQVGLSAHNHQFLVDLCSIDGTEIQYAVTELVNQGIRSLRRHVKTV